MKNLPVFRLSVPLAVIAFGCLASPSAPSALTDVVWDGAANSDFGTAANWGTNVLPGGANQAVINGSLSGGSPVSLSGISNPTIGGLTVASGFTLSRAAADISDRSLTILATTAADTSVINAGTIASGGTSGSLTITLNGSGSIFTNSGTIEATAGTSLIFSKGQSAPSVVNTGGTIRTVGTGTLSLTGGGNSSWGITGGNLTNAAGTINMLIRNPFTLTDVIFSNGGTANFNEPSLTSSGGYGIRLAGTSSLTNTGTINITRNPSLNVNTGAKNAGIITSVATTSINNSGTINISTVGDSATSGAGFGGFDFTDSNLVYTLTNTGVINLESRSSTHNTVFNATSTSGAGVTIEGIGGEIVLKVVAGGSVNRVFFTGANGIITQSAGHTIRGAGNIGADQIKTFTNTGTVRADDPTYALTIDPLGAQASFANVGTFTNNGTLRATGAGGLILNDGKFTNNGTFQIDAVSSLTLNSGAVLTNNATKTLNINGTWSNGTGGLIVNNGSLVYDSSANSSNRVGLAGSGSLTKSGGGSLTLSGANSSTGTTTLNAGALVVSTGNASALAATRTNSTFTVTLTAGDTAGLVVGQAITGTGIPTDSYITGIVNSTQFTINNNALSTTSDPLTAAAYSTLGSGALTVNGGTLNLGTGSHTVGAVTVAGGTISNGTLTGTGYDGRSGSVSAVLAGAVSLTKTTVGTLILSGASTYSGGTTITGGTLRVNNVTGSGTGSGAVSLGSGATLAGAGTLSGLVTTGDLTSVIAPGNSPGTLTLTGGLDASAGATFNFELGTVSDLINLGAFTGSTAAGGLSFNFADAGGIMAGVTYTLLDYTSASGLDYSDLFVNSMAAGLVLDSSFGTNGFFIDSPNGLLQVQFAPIPEPSAGALLLTGISVIFVIRRFKTRRA